MWNEFLPYILGPSLRPVLPLLSRHAFISSSFHYKQIQYDRLFSDDFTDAVDQANMTFTGFPAVVSTCVSQEDYIDN